MVKAVVEGNSETGFIPLDVDPALLAALANDMAPLGTGVGTREEILLELIGIKTAIRSWYDKQPDQVIREASAYSARLTELWTELQLREPWERTYTRLRTQQVQPVRDEVGRQFEFAKSRIAMNRQDIDLSTRS